MNNPVGLPGGSGLRSREVFVALRLARLAVCGRYLSEARARLLVPVVAFGYLLFAIGYQPTSGRYRTRTYDLAHVKRVL